MTPVQPGAMLPTEEWPQGPDLKEGTIRIVPRRMEDKDET